MFAFFRKEQQGIHRTDLVFLSDAARQMALAEKLGMEKDTVLVCWFSDDLDNMLQWSKEQGLTNAVYFFHELPSHQSQQSKIFFFGHHPLILREQALLDRLQLKEAIFYTSLEAPMFLHFGGGQILAMARQMGVSESEPLQHSLISASIRKAQEKLQSSVTNERPAANEAEWFSKNTGQVY